MSVSNKFVMIVIVLILIVSVLFSLDASAATDLFSKGEKKLTEAAAGITKWFWGAASIAGVIAFIMFFSGKAQWKILGGIAIAIFGVASIGELITFLKT